MKKLLFILVFLFSAVSLFADTSVNLSLSRNEISITDTIRLTVSVSGSRSGDVAEIRGLENFYSSEGGQSSRVQIINGKMDSSIDYSYSIQPKKTGTFEIGPAVIKIGGKTFQSNTVQLAVKNQGESGSVRNTDEPVFLTASLSSKNVYLEEQLIYTLQLYYANEISNLSIQNLPESDGLDFKQIGKPSQYQTNVKSKRYNVVEIKFFLTPSKPGKFNINPARMGMMVRGSGGRGSDDIDDFFNDDFFSRVRGKSVTIASNSLTLDVLNVPETGRPASYTGLIGDYKISASLDPLLVKAGESATLTVVLEGRGNVNRMPDLKIPEIADLKTYSDEPSLETSQTPNGAYGKKTMKWAIVPQKEGAFTLPSFSVSYFNSVSGSYKQISTRPLKLSASPGTGAMYDPSLAKAKAGNFKKEVEELATDILPTHSSLGGYSSGRISLALIILLLLIPPLAFFSVFLYSGLSKLSPEKEAKLKSAKAAKVFFKKCSSETTVNDLSNALREYFSSRFNLTSGFIAPENAYRILKEKGCNEDTSQRMEWFLKKMETYLYTGKGDEACELADEANIIIQSIEKEIK